MKIKNKTVVVGNGLSALAARHKGAARSRVQTHKTRKSARPGGDKPSAGRSARKP
jgi:hypothetical protein